MPYARNSTHCYYTEFRLVEHTDKEASHSDSVMSAGVRMGMQHSLCIQRGEALSYSRGAPKKDRTYLVGEEGVLGWGEHMKEAFQANCTTHWRTIFR